MVGLVQSKTIIKPQPNNESLMSKPSLSLIMLQNSKLHDALHLVIKVAYMYAYMYVDSSKMYDFFKSTSITFASSFKTEEASEMSTFTLIRWHKGTRYFVFIFRQICIDMFIKNVTVVHAHVHKDVGII